MLTIFSCPKPFRDPHINLIQRNALTSWTQLRPMPEIILLGDEEGVADICRELGFVHLPKIARSAYGTPLVSDIFRQAEANSTNRTMAYINSDIILFNDLLAAVAHIQKQQFLMIGYRIDADVTDPIDFANPKWQDDISAYATTAGRLHEHTGTDYFVFNSGLFRDMPPFALGRTTYDNWFIWKARSMDIPVIDATAVVKCIHQNHGYSFSLVGQAASSSVDDISRGEEAARNRNMITGWREIYTLHDANMLLTRSGLKRAWTPAHIKRRLRLATPDAGARAARAVLDLLRTRQQA